MNEFTFGRKINYVPLLVSLGVGIIISIFFFMLFNQTVISILFGVLSLVVAIGLYLINLSNSYGYWEISQQEIIYCDYNSNGKKLQAILFPFGKHQTELKLDQIKSASLVVGKKMTVPANIKAAPPSAYLVCYYPSAYYLGLKLKNDQEVDLDLSRDEENKDKIEQLIKLLVIRCKKQFRS